MHDFQSQNLVVVLIIYLYIVINQNQFFIISSLFTSTVISLFLQYYSNFQFKYGSSCMLQVFFNPCAQTVRYTVHMHNSFTCLEACDKTNINEKLTSGEVSSCICLILSDWLIKRQLSQIAKYGEQLSTKQAILNFCLQHNLFTQAPGFFNETAVFCLLV